MMNHTQGTYGVVHDKGHTVPRVERAEEGLEVIPVPEEDVREDSAEGQVGGDQVQGVGGREVRGLSCRPVSPATSIKRVERHVRRAARTWRGRTCRP